MIKMKLNTLLKKFSVNSTGFPAFAGLGEHSNEKGVDVMLSTLPAAVLASQGVTEYYAPVIPRDSKFMTTDDVLKADLDVQEYKIEHNVSWNGGAGNTVIVSRHQGTIDYIKNNSGNADVQILDGNITAEDIQGKQVIGTLPPHLITECDAYIAVSIKDFDYAKDGDLQGEELRNRIVFNDPIRLIDKSRLHVLSMTFMDTIEMGYGGGQFKELETFEEAYKIASQCSGESGYTSITYYHPNGKVWSIGGDWYLNDNEHEELLEKMKEFESVNK